MRYKKKFIIIFFVLLQCIFFGCGSKTVYYQNGDVSEDEDDGQTVWDTESDEKMVYYDASEEKIANCAVYVCGAVKNPGVYYLDEGAIKQDALTVAGGFAEGAAESYVNLAGRITDGERIYFPYLDELDDGISFDEEEPESGNDDSAMDDGKVNLNTATKEQLMTLPGIGESKADAIIKYREEHGNFTTVEDVKKVNGIKDGVYNKIKDYAVVK